MSIFFLSVLDKKLVLSCLVRNRENCVNTRFHLTANFFSDLNVIFGACGSQITYLYMCVAKDQLCQYAASCYHSVCCCCCCVVWRWFYATWVAPESLSVKATLDKEKHQSLATEVFLFFF